MVGIEGKYYGVYLEGNTLEPLAIRSILDKFYFSSQVASVYC